MTFFWGISLIYVRQVIIVVRPSCISTVGIVESIQFQLHVRSNQMDTTNEVYQLCLGEESRSVRPKIGKELKNNNNFFYGIFSFGMNFERVLERLREFFNNEYHAYFYNCKLLCNELFTLNLTFSICMNSINIINI